MAPPLHKGCGTCVVFLLSACLVQVPATAPDWSAVFADPTLPLAVDIGSGYGRFLLLLQRNNPNRQINYLGIEIRRTVGVV